MMMMMMIKMIMMLHALNDNGEMRNPAPFETRLTHTTKNNTTLTTTTTTISNSSVCNTQYGMLFDIAWNTSYPFVVMLS